MKKQISPEVRLERARLDIAKLDNDIKKNWTPIAEEEQDIKGLKRDLDSLRASVERTESELQVAVADLKAGVKRIKFRGGEKTEAEARRALIAEANALSSRKHELDSREKQLSTKQQPLTPAMSTHDEIIRHPSS